MPAPWLFASREIVALTVAVVNRCECVKSENIPRFRKFTEKRDIIVQRERKRKRGRREERVRDERERERIYTSGEAIGIWTWVKSNSSASTLSLTLRNNPNGVWRYILARALMAPCPVLRYQPLHSRPFPLGCSIALRVHISMSFLDYRT